MNDDFTQSALRFNALAAQHLSWSPDGFWKATPTELLTALGDPAHWSGPVMTSATIQQMMERDAHG